MSAPRRRHEGHQAGGHLDHDYHDDEQGGEVEDTIYVTPTIIRRVNHGERTLTVINVPDEETGERSLLVFMNEDQADAFRADTGRFPASEGFEVGAVDRDGLEAICAVWGFKRVALREPEPEAVSVLDADVFCEMLEPAGTPREA